MAEPALRDAEGALDALAADGPPPDLGDRYDALAASAADAGDLALAARAEQKALEHGCADPRVAREMLAWYRLGAGQRAAGEFAFASLLAERGEDDVELALTIAAARRDAGHDDDALDAADAALAAARVHDDPAELALARAERAALREELGLAPDEDDRRAREAAEGTLLAVGWIPRDEQAAAARRWPWLAADVADPDAYCRAVERALRAERGRGRAVALAALRVRAVLACARDEGLDPDARETLARHAGRLEERVPWPPARGAPCWCRSGRAYRRCCGAG